MVSLFPDALAAPRYLIPGVPGVQIPQGLPGGRAAPPSPRSGLGGPLRPVAQLDFPTQTPPPAPPPSRGPAPPRCRVPPSPAPPRLLPVPFASAQVPKKIPNEDCRLRGSTCRVQPRSLPVKPRCIWITRLSEVNPAPGSSPALRPSHTFFRPYSSAHSFEATPLSQDLPLPLLLSPSRSRSPELSGPPQTPTSH